MATLSRIDHAQATTNPERAFRAPEDVVKEVGLTRGEKIGLLERWGLTVQRRLDSAAEGMAPEPSPEGGPQGAPVDDDAELLRQIELALEQVRRRDEAR